MPSPDPYGSDHRLRRQKELDGAFNTPCSVCGQLMLKGQELDFAHGQEDLALNPSAKATEFQHASCNRSEGGKLAARIRDLKPSRDW